MSDRWILMSRANWPAATAARRGTGTNANGIRLMNEWRPGLRIGKSGGRRGEPFGLGSPAGASPALAGPDLQRPRGNPVLEEAPMPSLAAHPPPVPGKLVPTIRCLHSVIRTVFAIC